MSEERFAERRRSTVIRRVKRILLGLLLASAVGALVWMVWFSNVLSVNRIQIEGATTLKSDVVRSAAAIRLGQPLARVDTVAIESRVAALERIDRVEVSRRWPRTIRIELVERRPVAWVTIGGVIRTLDRDGVDFRTLRKEPQDLVEVRIDTYDARQRQQALQSSTAVLELLRTDDPALLKKVQHVRAGSQDSVELVLSKNRTVTWGSAVKGKQKLRVLDALLGIKARNYDVSAPEQPTTRR